MSAFITQPVATNTTITGPTPYGVVTIDGIQYLERFQIFVDDVTVSTNNQVITNLRLTLPGVANFLLKGMTRDITIPGAPDSQDRRFRFRLLGAEGATTFLSSGLGVYDDRVFDNMCFGFGQFPFFIIPPVPVQASGSLFYEIEDSGINTGTDAFPYTIHFGFIGTYLIPLGTPNIQSFLYSVSGA